MRRSFAAAFCCVLSAMLLATHAKAQDASSSVSEAAVLAGSTPFSPIVDPVLGDPLYLPAKGKLYGQTGFSYGKPHSTRYDYRGVQSSVREGEEEAIGQSFAYGLLHGLSLHVGISYNFNSTDATTVATGALANSNSQGVNNPGVGLTYRAMDQKNHPVVVDLSLDYAPVLFGAVSDRQAIAASIGVGRAMRDFSVRVGAGVSYRPVHSYTSSSDAIRQDGYWGYSLSARGQARFSRRGSIDLGVTYSNPEDRRGENLTQHTASTTIESWGASAAVGVTYRLVPNRIVIGASYTHQFSGDGGTLNTDPIHNYVSRDVRRDTVGVSLRYALN